MSHVTDTNRGVSSHPSKVRDLQKYMYLDRKKDFVRGRQNQRNEVRLAVSVASQKQNNTSVNERQSVDALSIIETRVSFFACCIRLFTVC